LPDISHTANFRPTDTLPTILEDLACPACGYQDPGEAHHRITHNMIHIFCDCCGAFTTILLSDEQARAIQRLDPTTNTKPVEDH
jgi:hypothetical protein